MPVKANGGSAEVTVKPGCQGVNPDFLAVWPWASDYLCFINVFYRICNVFYTLHNLFSIEFIMLSIEHVSHSSYLASPDKVLRRGPDRMVLAANLSSLLEGRARLTKRWNGREWMGQEKEKGSVGRGAGEERKGTHIIIQTHQAGCCINHAFSFLYPCWPWEDCPSQNWPVPGDKQLTCQGTYIRKSPNPEPDPPLPLSGCHHVGPPFLS